MILEHARSAHNPCASRAWKHQHEIPAAAKVRHSSGSLGEGSGNVSEIIKQAKDVTQKIVDDAKNSA